MSAVVLVGAWLAAVVLGGGGLAALDDARERTDWTPRLRRRHALLGALLVAAALLVMLTWGVPK